MINLFNILKKKEKAVSVLDEFLKQIPSNEHLDANESRRNLEENLVELTYYGHHSSNGLLFSGRGYFLTAKHCVEDIEDLNRLRARLYNGETYNIKKICAVSNKSDIAIGKIDLPRRYNPKMFKIYNTDKLEKIPVVLLTRVNGKIKEKYGFIEKDWDPKESDSMNRFVSKIMGKPGDSGGIIISPYGELIGIERGGDGNSYTSCIKIKKALDLIEFYKNQNS